MAYRGDFDPSSIVDLKFTTISGAIPTTLSGSPAISVYKANSTTESTAGVTLTVDFDGRTGMNHVRIDTSADGTFYAAGNDFDVVITTGTVGGYNAVGYVVGSFSIQNRSPLRPATAGRTVSVDSSGRVDVGSWLGSAVQKDANNLPKVDLEDIVGAAVSSTTAQLGVNVVKWNGTTVGALPANFSSLSIDASGRVDVGSWLGSAVQKDANNLPKVDLEDIVGAAVSTTTAQLGVNVVKWNGTAVGALPGNFSSLSIDSSGNVKIQKPFRKNTAYSNYVFRMRDSSGNPLTGLTVTAKRRIDGGSFASCANSATEITGPPDGFYTINLSAADLNGDNVVLLFTATGAQDISTQISTVP